MSFLSPIGIIPLYQNIEALEKKLNVFGYIPIAGAFSGKIIRGTLVAAEIIAGIALAIFYAFFTFGNPLASFYGKTAVVFLKHGVLNAIRGNIEQKTVGGCLICLPFDLFFGKIFPYPI